MRINPNKLPWAAVDDRWFSSTLSPDFLAAGRTDPSLWPAAAKLVTGFDTTAMAESRAWATSQKIAWVFQGGGNLGLPASAVEQAITALGPLIMNPPDDLKQLMFALARTAIGVALDTIAAIPIVGPIIRAIGSFALFIVDVVGKKPEEVAEYLPPLIDYRDDAEEFVMNELLPRLGQSDWTWLFCPRHDNMPEIVELQTGWLLKGEHAGGGLGFIPGTQSIHSGLQAFWHTKSARGGSLASSQDVGDFYPGPAQLMTGLAAQLQQPGAALWAVDPDRVRSAWRDHVYAFMSFALELYSGNKAAIRGTGLDRLSQDQRHVVVQALVAPLHVSRLPSGDIGRGVLAATAWTPKGSTQPDSIVDAFVEPWCQRLERRQRIYAGTTAAAYADPSSAAFAGNPRLRDWLERGRALLLASSVRHDIDQRDVVDPIFLKKLQQATSDDPPYAGRPQSRRPLTPDGSSLEPDAPDFPQGGVPFEREVKHIGGKRNSRGGGGLLAMGLGVGAFLGLRLLKRHRRR